MSTATDALPASVRGNSANSIGWLLVALFAFCNLAPALTDGMPPFLSLLGSFTLVAFGIVHGASRYGLNRMLIAVAIVFVLGMIIENISVVTGFPFGFFQHTDIFGPKLIAIPYLIGFLYFTLTYTGWAIANLLLGDADADGKPTSILALPLVGAFIPAAMDATFDPIGATLNHGWIFKGGGGFYGVPLENFLGIMFVNYVCYQIFMLYLARKPAAVRSGQSIGWQLQPVAVLGVFAITPLILMATKPDVTATDDGGAIWRSSHMYEG
ncbi:MAG: carotenoid biosynthesis protein, partial [Caulobacterales bacterium]